METKSHSQCKFSCSDAKLKVPGDFSDAYKLLEIGNKTDKENLVFSLQHKHDNFNAQFPEYNGIETSRNVLQPKPIVPLQSVNFNKSFCIPSDLVSETSSLKLLDNRDEVLLPDSCSYPHSIIKPPKAANASQPVKTAPSIRSSCWVKSVCSPSKHLSEHLDALNIKNEAAIKSSQTHSYTPESSPVLNAKRDIFDNNFFASDLSISYKKLCNECNTDSAEFVLTPCGHKICQKCLGSLINSTPINLCTCYICHKPITCFTSRISLESNFAYNKFQPTCDFVASKDCSFGNSFDIKQLKHSSFIEENHESLNTMTNSFLKEALMTGKLFADISTLVTPQDWTCLKISNIPWDLSIEAIYEFLGKNARIAPYSVHSQPIHFIMDRMSAKTQSECYVELSSRNDAQRLAERRSGKLLGSRNVVLEIATQEELMNRIFPKWKGEWKGVDPYADENLKSIRQFSIPKAEIVTREELNSLINHVKTYRSPYSRKCPQRPFEDFISILAKFPWHKGDFYTLGQRDLLHSSLLTLIEILKGHLKKGRLPELNFRLLERLVHAGTTNTCFTEKQKFEIFKIAGLPCNFEANKIALINLDLKAVSCLKIDHLYTTEVFSFLMYNGFKTNDLQLSEKEIYSLSDVAKIELSYINAKMLKYMSSVLPTKLHSAST
ncbi:hypothetical protein PORY_001456 [Pneumocystis oryctolagi]|uniref:Uncharacterized protein n=1 Tax=Pneumocystis oryctolagi TaxID=42067 RepID=A0ACB7CCC6_9ASCO|nr:hypothetical protein PORY_001456 [Pneumocystis oryctolagi]